MKPTESSNTLTSSNKQLLWQEILHHAFQQGDSVALWRLPNDDVQQLIISGTSKTLQPQDTLEELPVGFMIAPFMAGSRTFLPADYYFRFSDQALLRPNTSLENNSHTWLKQLSKAAQPIRPNFYQKENGLAVTSDKNAYINLVENAIVLIKEGLAEKIVPSRSKSVTADFNLLDAFDKLCQRYPAAMISLISTPTHGTWLGATPELLVSIDDKHIFKTVALAGTKAWVEGTDSKNVAWTQKEIEEQALVERYIISCFKKIRLRDYEEQGPKTIIAGNLMHLKSDFKVDMKATNFPQLGTVMLDLLHPTSAVCGMPKDIALQFLNTHEGYARELYSGYLGPVNVQGNTSLFVNLRCLQWHASMARVYAGAGVTIDSQAHKEWEETEMKMNTLISVIFDQSTKHTL